MYCCCKLLVFILYHKCTQVFFVTGKKSSLIVIFQWECVSHLYWPKWKTFRNSTEQIEKKSRSKNRKSNLVCHSKAMAEFLRISMVTQLSELSQNLQLFFSFYSVSHNYGLNFFVCLARLKLNETGLLYNFLYP